MFKAAVAGTLKAVTANRLIDGLVVFVGEGPAWVTDIAEAATFEDGAALEEALAFGAAEAAARRIIDPYAIDVTIEDGKPVPERLRELIRARGPTVDFGEAERKRLAGESGAQR